MRATRLLERHLMNSSTDWRTVTTDMRQCQRADLRWSCYDYKRGQKPDWHDRSIRPVAEQSRRGGIGAQASSKTLDGKSKTF
jgi:hypothetical protein